VNLSYLLTSARRLPVLEFDFLHVKEIYLGFKTLTSKLFALRVKTAIFHNSFGKSVLKNIPNFNKRDWEK
jgi:hypothetical protein